MSDTDKSRSMAVFIDFENLALGFKNSRKKFQVNLVLERLLEKGKIIVKKSYADWSRYDDYKRQLHENAIELIEIPKRNQTGKNSADIRLAVDAMDLSWEKEHIDTFVIVSGDSDFSPLVSKLKENGRHVIGIGMEESTSSLLRDNCDEFIYYEDLFATVGEPPKLNPKLPKKKQEAFGYIIDAVSALGRENVEVIYSSMVKDTIMRKKPSFNEAYHGYRSFQELLEDARDVGLINLEKSQRSGTYVVTGFTTKS